MVRERFSRLLENQARQLKILGLYTAVVLFAFLLVIPVLGRQAQKNQVIPPGLPENAGETGGQPLETVAVAPDKVPDDGKAEPYIDSTIKFDKAAKTHVSLNTDITKIIWPVKGQVIREAGLSYSRTYSDYRYHNGIDIRAKKSDVVVAVLAGQVTGVETSKSEAKKILIDHGSGWQSVSAHLGEVCLKKGDTVRAGQTVGYVGEPGLAEIMEGPHLHFALLKNGQVVNPLDYLPK